MSAQFQSHVRIEVGFNSLPRLCCFLPFFSFRYGAAFTRRSTCNCVPTPMVTVDTYWSYDDEPRPILGVPILTSKVISLEELCGTYACAWHEYHSSDYNDRVEDSMTLSLNANIEPGAPVLPRNVVGSLLLGEMEFTIKSLKFWVKDGIRACNRWVVDEFDYEHPFDEDDAEGCTISVLDAVDDNGFPLVDFAVNFGPYQDGFLSGQPIVSFLGKKVKDGEKPVGLTKSEWERFGTRLLRHESDGRAGSDRGEQIESDGCMTSCIGVDVRKALKSEHTTDHKKTDGTFMGAPTGIKRKAEDDLDLIPCDRRPPPPPHQSVHVNSNNINTHNGLTQKRAKIEAPVRPELDCACPVCHQGGKSSARARLFTPGGLIEHLMCSSAPGHNGYFIADRKTRAMLLGLPREQYLVELLKHVSQPQSSSVEQVA
ncbi:hypothetical protein BV22DRAFT_417188 [Leucogyrophana mollusca]|uniref:Uncharacterized protein n=1 Tax=Leucogyrophana mollusca TaxID=85980 RepID=A0ACB8BLE7_9AGAM|nr:hypothetical protein BV22DRAFT_417188 [Leucogyrophana mollusca]